MLKLNLEHQANGPTQHSDLTSPITTLIVGPGPEPTTFYVHTEGLLRLPFFAAALQGDFLEAHSNVIRMPEDNPEIVSKLIEYLYTDQYQPNFDPVTIPAGAESLSASMENHYVKMLHSQVFILADKYDCPGLRQLSLHNLLERFGAVEIEEPQMLLDYWVYIYENTSGQSRLRIPYNYAMDAEGTREWVIRLWESKGGGLGRMLSRERSGLLEDALRRCPELARDMLVLVCGGRFVDIEGRKAEKAEKMHGVYSDSIKIDL